MLTMSAFATPSACRLCLHGISICLVYCSGRTKSATATRYWWNNGGVGGLYYGAREANFEAKASEDGLAGVGGRRRVVVAGGQCIRGRYWSSNGYSVAGHGSASRNRSRRRGNLRRQLGDVLCLRQGKRRSIPTQSRTKACIRRLSRLWGLQGLWRRQRLRWLPRLRGRLQGLRRLWWCLVGRGRLLGRLQLLRVLGGLSLVLDLS